MENTGGHGTVLEIETCAKTSLDEVSIKKNHQVTKLPETNQLDLGLQASLQSSVEYLSWRQGQDQDILNATVLSSWESVPVKTIGKVFERWVKVLDLMLKDNRDSLKVRRKKIDVKPPKTSRNNLQCCDKNSKLVWPTSFATEFLNCRPHVERQ